MLALHISPTPKFKVDEGCTCRYDPKPINSTAEWLLPNFICTNDVNSDSFAFGKQV
jgi:hypothetical protein